tara:strand:+ start:2796 stop:2975 length:180 start_codon:yes stop_codon:yes gene_type:complete
MWILILILFSGPNEIKHIDVLEHHFVEQKCANRIEDAIKAGLPSNSSIACVKIKHITKT